MTQAYHSPADVVRHAMITADPAVATLPTDGGLWPVYVAHLPNEPADAVCVFDTQGKFDGREMDTGRTVEHPGVQIRVRASSHQRAMAKIREITEFLDGVLRQVVEINPDSYTLQATSRSGGILPLGQDQHRRTSFTTNATVTINP